MATRLETLRWLYDITGDAIVDAPVDKMSPLIGQMRAIIVEISELDRESDGVVETNGLIDFQAALVERQQSAAKIPRRTAH